jgi:acetolactate synthase I/II/III large subunit
VHPTLSNFFFNFLFPLQFPQSTATMNGTSSIANGNPKVQDLPFRYTASAAFIDTLITAGVKYLFVNLGTDHPGLVEVFAHASLNQRRNFPRVLTCPNEMVALTVAHSYAQITGECQAVLLHVETGTLAMAGALHNAAKSRVPVLVWAGASPSTIEGEVLGGRTEFIQFQQE